MRPTLVVSFWRCAARCGRRYAADGELAPSAIVFINLTELAPAKPFSPPRSYRALTGVAWLCDHDQSMWVLDGTRYKGGDKRDDQQHAPAGPGSQLRCSTLGPLLPTSLRCLSMLVSVRAAHMQVNGAFRFEQTSETQYGPDCTWTGGQSPFRPGPR